MEYTPLLVPFLYILGIAAILTGVFGLTLLFISRDYGDKKKIIDAEFTEVPKRKPYKPGDIINRKA